MIFDTHIHLNDERLIDNLDEYIRKAKEKGVSYFLCIGYDVESSKKAVEIANKYECVYASVGLIPTEHKQYNKDSISELRKIATSSNKVIAIGEIGLDYYWENEESIKKTQKEMFIKQIELANELNLPISIHCRDAYGDTLEILKQYKVNNAGIMHCYSGSYESAVEFIKLGFYIAFGGVLTFKNSVKTKEVLEKIPKNCIVFETDAPYLAPTPYRGKTNLPEYIYETVKYANEYLNKDITDIAFNNSLKILKLDGKIKD